MNSLKKVATKFNNLLIIAKIESLEQIKQIYFAAQALYRTKDLWLTAVEYEPMVESPLENIWNLTKKYYWNASKFGISASSSAKYLNLLKDETSDLKEAKLASPLDPLAIKSLERLTRTLNNTIPYNIEPPIPKEKPQLIPADVPPESPDFYLRS